MKKILAIRPIVTAENKNKFISGDLIKPISISLLETKTNLTPDQFKANNSYIREMAAKNNCSLEFTAPLRFNAEVSLLGLSTNNGTDAIYDPFDCNLKISAIYVKMYGHVLKWSLLHIPSNCAAITEDGLHTQIKYANLELNSASRDIYNQEIPELSFLKEKDAIISIDILINAYFNEHALGVVNCSKEYRFNLITAANQDITMDLKNGFEDWLSYSKFEPIGYDLARVSKEEHNFPIGINE